MMKYLTKEWYETMQKTSFNLLLKVSKKAETYSEAYFNELYKREEKKWLKYREEVSKLKLEDIYPEKFEAEYDDGISMDPSAYEEAKRDYFEMREQVRLDLENAPPFDPDQEKEDFRQAFRYGVKHLEENLPDHILQKVADVRVLALNRASADVKKIITAYCKANEKIVESTLKAYEAEYGRTFKDAEPDFAEGFDFHDCKVVSCRKKGKDLVITIDNSGGFTTISQIIFRNCSILLQDKRLHGAWWLYDEVYRKNDRYEVHILLQSHKELVDFIVNVTDVTYN
jgi:hypothetical protein